MTMPVTALFVLHLIAGPADSGVPGASFAGCYEVRMSKKTGEIVTDMLPPKLQLLPPRKKGGEWEGRVRGYDQGKEVRLAKMLPTDKTAWELRPAPESIVIYWRMSLFGGWAVELSRKDALLVGATEIVSDEIGGPVVSFPTQLTPIPCSRLEEK